MNVHLRELWYYDKYIDGTCVQTSMLRSNWLFMRKEKNAIDGNEL